MPEITVTAGPIDIRISVSEEELTHIAAALAAQMHLGRAAASPGLEPDAPNVSGIRPPNPAENSTWPQCDPSDSPQSDGEANQSASQSPCLGRDPAQLTVVQSRILSSLTPQKLSRIREVETVSRPDKFHANVNFLIDRKFVQRLEIGRYAYLFLMRDGILHPQYRKADPKAHIADVERDYGVARIRFLQVVDMLGTACTVDVTYAIPDDFFDGTLTSAGNIAQELRKKGLIEDVQERQRNKQARFKLTDEGRLLLQVLSAFIPPVDRVALRERIDEKRRRRREVRVEVGRRNARGGILDMRLIRRGPPHEPNPISAKETPK